MQTISTKGDGTLTKTYTCPNWQVISGLVARKRRPTELDKMAMDKTSPINATSEDSVELPTDDLLLILFNELEARFETKCLAYCLGVLLNDGFKTYLKGKQGLDLHREKPLKTEDDILAIHKPNLGLAKKFYSGTIADDRKCDLSRPWCAENKVSIRSNVTEHRVSYELMDYFKAGYRDTLIQLMFDGVKRYLETYEPGQADTKPPKASELKGG